MMTLITLGNPKKPYAPYEPKEERELNPQERQTKPIMSHKYPLKNVA